MVRSGTVWAWAAVAPSNIASANELVSFICFSLEPAHFRSRINSVAPASGRTKGPGRHAGMLRKRLHKFKQSPMSYSSRIANWGRRHSERERFRAKACPGLLRGWTPVRVKKTRQNKRIEPGSDSIRTEKALGRLSIEFEIIEPDIERGRTVRQPAGRYQIDAGRRDCLGACGGDAAGSLGDRTVAGHGDGLPEFVYRHIVEQNRIHAERQYLFELQQCIDLDLDLDEVPRMRFRALDRGADVARKRDVIVLDQNGVVEAEAVIAAAAGADRIFLERAKSGCRLAGADDACPRSLRGGDERGGRRCNAAQVTEKVQRCPFGGQQTSCGPVDGGDDLSRRDNAAVGPLGDEPDCR